MRVDRRPITGVLFAVALVTILGVTYAEPVKVTVILDVTAVGSDPGFIEFKIESDSQGEQATGHLEQAGHYEFTWNMGDSGGNSIWFWWDTLDGGVRIQMWVQDQITLDADCQGDGEGEKNVLVHATQKRISFMHPEGYLKHGDKPEITYIEVPGFLGIVWNDQDGAAHNWDSGGGHYYRVYKPQISKNTDGTWYASAKMDHDVFLGKDDHAYLEWWFDAKCDLVQTQVKISVGDLDTGPIRLTVQEAAALSGYPAVGKIADETLKAIERIHNWLAETGEGRRIFPSQIKHVINMLGCKIHDHIRKQ